MTTTIKQEHIVREISAPTIVIDDIVTIDAEFGTTDNASGNSTYPVKYSLMQGSEHPLVQINDFLYKDEDIMSMDIDTRYFLPTISLKINVRSKLVFTAGFPLDGDLISVFIRSKDSNLKPIRNDYEITSVEVHDSGDETHPAIMILSGILFVQGLSTMKCFSMRGTSIDVLQRVAQDLKLGFATNEVQTNDEQTWICPYVSVQDFIKHVNNAAWKDTTSFFTVFVDIYYHLNFVNIDPLFSIEPGLELGISNENFSNDYDIDMKQINSSHAIIFSNNEMMRYNNFHVKKYEQVNHSNNVSRSDGYLKYNHHYDALIRKKVVLYADTRITPGSENDMYIMKGRKNADNRKDRVTHTWNGVLYGENGENQNPKYTFSRTWNYQNILHLDKLYLDILVENINANIRRFQVVPLLITVENDNERRFYNEPPDKSENSVQFVVEKFYTGNYVIDSIGYSYKNGRFNQHMKFMRREWPKPPGFGT